jgi:hypothetical protein
MNLPGLGPITGNACTLQRLTNGGNGPQQQENPKAQLMQSITRNIAATLALGCLFATTATAQSQVDIGLYQNNDQLEVRVKPRSEFSGIVSSVVFTIKWDRSGGATLGQVKQDEAVQQYLPLGRSGNAREHGAMNYQVFAGFGTTPLTNSGAPWVAGEEYTIATISVTGRGEFELVNDAWTAEPANNANFYVSLGGQDMTGNIYKSLVTADEDASVVIQPNPNNGQFNFTFQNATPMDITVEVMNSLGQAVFTDVIPSFEGTYRKEMDITSMSNGVYYLKVKRGENTSVHKIVYQ